MPSDRMKVFREQAFLRQSAEKAKDLDHRQKMNHALKQSDDAFERGKGQFADLELARDWASAIKRDTIMQLDAYLCEFEERFTGRGGKVIWAQTADEAVSAIKAICSRHGARTVVKSKSMVTEEIHLNKALSDDGMDVIETDLGEYIQQLAGEAPYHIVAPSLHKSKEEVAQLFVDKLDAEPGLPPDQLTRVARKVLRKKFREAEVGITGVNFLLADIGGMVLTENEGNGRLSTGFPKVHIAITGIEKILPSVQHLNLFLPLLATHGSGQRITVYNSILTGPRREDEVDGPEEMYVILLDNGRTKLLADPTARESLYCIRCGACLNVCPVYKNIGGHTYDTTYSGPIGSVITPHLSGMKDSKHLSYASSLCGGCTEVCPVRIPLHNLLLYNRQQSVEAGYTNRVEKMAFWGWKQVMLNRKLMNVGNGGVKNRFFAAFMAGIWGKDRALPVFPARNFSQQWKSRRQAEQRNGNNKG